jgi:hypothetical protein
MYKKNNNNNNKFTILLVGIIIIILLILNNNSKLDNVKNYDIVVSINVHEKVNFLLEQLNNIRQYIKSSYCVVLNCNDYMYNELKNKDLKLDNIIFINNEIINKKRFHGSLFHGIYSNIKYSLKNFNFKYFFILSSRNIFFQDIDILRLENLFNLKDPPTQIDSLTYDYTDESKWYHWVYIKHTKLAQYYMNKRANLYNSPHEGLVIKKSGCEVIYNFLNTHNHIKKDLFNTNTVSEEFALQTILKNETDDKTPLLSLNYGSIVEDNVPAPENLNTPFYVRKINRK